MAGNHLRFEVFRLQLTAKEKPLAPCAWANLTGAPLCNRELYMPWAFWLSRIYKKPSKGKSGDLAMILSWLISTASLPWQTPRSIPGVIATVLYVPRLQGELRGGKVAAGRQGQNAQAHFPALHHEQHPHGYER